MLHKKIANYSYDCSFQITIFSYTYRTLQKNYKNIHLERIKNEIIIIFQLLLVSSSSQLL